MKIKDVVAEGVFDYFTSSAVANKGYKTFIKLLKDNNININNPQPEIAAKLPEYLKQWTINYMSGGDRRNEQPAIIAKIQAIPIPPTINAATTRQYITAATEARAQAKEEIKIRLPAAPAAPAVEKPKPVAGPLPADLTVVSSSPVVLRYRNQDFSLTDNGRWVRFGSTKLATPEMEAYLNRQLEKL